MLPAAALVAVHLVSSLPHLPADDLPKHARADQPVTLFAVLEFDDRQLYAAAPSVRIAGRTHTTRPLAEAPGKVDLAWFKIEPTTENMSNTETGEFSFRAIDYGASEMTAWHGRGQVSADVRPTLTPDRGDGVGTMRFRVVVTVDGRQVATPGPEARRGRGSGGLSDAVHRISVRRDDSYVGWLTELYGQPYIWASAGVTDRTHQSERLEGSDCADFVTYGWRRLGHDVPYTWTEGLRKYTRRRAAGTADATGVYVDARGRPLAFPGVGVLVLFPRHVGVLVGDRGTPGVLDVEDRMAHALFASPREEAIGTSGYAGTLLEVLTWKD